MIDKERIISMKRMSSKEIKEAIENVRASLAVENIEMDELSVIIGEKYLKGEISSEEAIDIITEYIKGKQSG
jgi:F0F1-type ATP synthase membrane subunit b/b'